MLIWKLREAQGKSESGRLARRTTTSPTSLTTLSRSGARVHGYPVGFLVSSHGLQSATRAHPSVPPITTTMPQPGPPVQQGIHPHAEVRGQSFVAFTSSAFSHDYLAVMAYWGTITSGLYYTLDLSASTSPSRSTSTNPLSSRAHTEVKGSEDTSESSMETLGGRPCVVGPAEEEKAQMVAQEEDHGKELKAPEEHKKVPVRHALAFIISFSVVFLGGLGGSVSWGNSICIGATFDITEACVTHQLLHRPWQQTCLQPQ
ncbi:LOW QUALITY PROTEIN: Pescadillo [Galemys pyrenaicus]|uniref:Pescadillo n=1 Tax=Galemys pyrenaicus TaxID=202257 RepID=A0A8J6DK59_GALPY|nr:LOW QUALITY PROTEIN: Pescadillo [Galemys pyrenaicus]